MKQGPQESAVSFANRIKAAGIDMKEAATQEGRPINSESIKRDMVEYFWRGVQDRIKTRVERRPRDIDEAVVEARKVEQQIGKEIMNKPDDRILVTRETPASNPDIRAAWGKSNGQIKPDCQFCGRRGHIARECWKIIGKPNQTAQRTYEPRVQQGRTTRQSASPQRKFIGAGDPRRCFGCGKEGHIRSNCPEQRFQPSTQQQEQRAQQQKSWPENLAFRQQRDVRQDQGAVAKVPAHNGENMQYWKQPQTGNGTFSNDEKKNGKWVLA